MPDLEAIVKVLKVVPTIELRRTLVRRVPLTPLINPDAVDFLFTSGRPNRFNPPLVQCIYFAEDERTAAAEYQRHNVRRHQPFATFFGKVNLRHVIDLCAPESVAALGMKAADLQAVWIGSSKLVSTQFLGQALSEQAQIAAVRFPSEAARAAGFAGANVVIFKESVRRPDSVRILGLAKNQLQKWP